MTNELSSLLLQEARRRIIGESMPRIKRCLAELDPTEVWFRPNENSNSVGNLVLHLCGNARQWLLSGLGGETDERNRQAEFDEKGPLPTQQLVDELDKLAEEIEVLLLRLTPNEILRPIEVQGFQENGVSILVHVVEHFSYHTGQITYFTKWRKNIHTGYYMGVELNKVGKV